MEFTQAVATPITVLAVRALSQVFAFLLQVALRLLTKNALFVETAIFSFRRPPERLFYSLLWRQRGNGQIM